MLKKIKSAFANNSKKNSLSSATKLIKNATSKLSKSHLNFQQQLSKLFLGKKTIDENLMQQLEELLICADVGITTSTNVITELTDKLNRKQLKDPQAVITSLQASLLGILEHSQQPLVINHKPFVIIMVGVNGAGKTTTIGKLAKLFCQQQKKVMLAAGDTFRAAAIEQLCAWGNQHQVPVIKQQLGADSAAVVFDAMQAAIAKDYDILIADTAGRLHTNQNLMSELQKIIRVLKKANPNCPLETMLVLDASLGQNALMQATTFHQALNVTGLTITKLDGSAKAGAIFNIVQKLQLPIRYIGTGETADDLQTFDAKQFVNSLFDNVSIS